MYCTYMEGESTIQQIISYYGIEIRIYIDSPLYITKTMNFNWVVALAIFNSLSLLHSATGSKILIIAAIATKSHFSFIGEVANVLAERGHDVSNSYLDFQEGFHILVGGRVGLYSHFVGFR